METSTAALGSLEPLLSIAELSEYLDVPVRTLYDWRLCGKGPLLDSRRPSAALLRQRRPGMADRAARAMTRTPRQPEQADEGEVIVGEVLQMPQLRAAREERPLWVDAILDSPTLTHAFMQELICRIALGLVLDDMRYQAAVYQLVVAYRMVGRIGRQVEVASRERVGGGVGCRGGLAAITKL